MNDLGIALVCTVIGAICTVLGTVIGYKTFKKTSIKDTKDEVKEDTESSTKFAMQLEYISRGVDDIKLDIKAQDRRISEVVERVAKVEESTKSAHHRIDDLEGKIK